MKLIQIIDRILWGTRVASITSPTYVSDYMPYDAETPSAASHHDGEPHSALRTHAEAPLVHA